MLKTILLASAMAFCTPAFTQTEAPAEPAPAEKSGTNKTLWRLLGGGEIVGFPVKETPAEVFIDIGPQIIGVPTASIMGKTLVDEIKDTTTGAGIGTGVFDEATGSVIFRSSSDTTSMLSQQEVLDRAKRSVVLVSNPAGLGTGWIFDRNGRLITNHHVVGEETFQTVTLFVKEGNQWTKKKITDCEVEAFSSLLDIAIVRLNMDQVKQQGIELAPLPIAEPNALQSGELVYAIGNPGMGRMVLDHSISEGIVSSTARNFNDVIYLQTTAAVNPGNSGGPLLNQRGEVVGLITLKAIFQEGVAFALPVDYIHFFIRQSNAFSINEMNTNKGFRYHKPQ